MKNEIKIKDGGQLERCEDSEGKKKLEKISFASDEHCRVIEMFINEDSLSYLSIEEALNMRDALNDVIKSATGI